MGYERFAPVLQGMQGLASGLLNSYDRNMQLKAQEKRDKEQREFLRESLQARLAAQRDMFDTEMELELAKSGFEKVPDTYIPEVGPLEQGMLVDGQRPQEGFLAPQRRFKQTTRGEVLEKGPLLARGVRADYDTGEVSLDPAWMKARESDNDFNNMVKLMALDMQRQGLNLRREDQRFKQEEAKRAALKTLNREFAKEAQKFQLSGGFSNEISNLQNLGEAVKTLQSGNDNISGPVVGSFPEFLRKRFYPESYNTERKVRQVLAQSLKPLLGGQFTRDELKMIISNSYDPALPESMNAETVSRTMETAERMLKAKEEALNYFINNNYSMEGYKGQTDFSAQAFNNMAGFDLTAGKKAEGETKGILPKNMTREELEKLSVEDLEKLAK